MKFPALIWILFITIFACLFDGCQGWTNEDLEIFDLVEEVSVNFYDFMGISQNATSTEIRKAFRNLSIVLHPDKNPSEDANIQFRNLVSVYEILRDPSKRMKYDKVLKEGLPNWKSALYYYRRMRKIGLYEGSAIVFIIISIGQYLFAWAAYVEKKYTTEQVFGPKLKKLQKRNKTIDMSSILNEIPTPSLMNTLPIQIPMFIWNMPYLLRGAVNKANKLKEQALEQRRLELEEAERQKELEEEAEKQARLRKEKKEYLRQRRQNAKAPEKTDEDLKGYSQIRQSKHIMGSDDNGAVRPVTHKEPLVTGSFWTDEDISELIRLVKKYPGGSISRWNTIAMAMNRSVNEVTFMAAKLKDSHFRSTNQYDSIAESVVQEAEAITKKVKAKKNKQLNKNIMVPETNWTQEQQRALEAGIVKYKKNTIGDRWQKIANCVPDKTKEECIQRYRYLCELVKAQNSNQDIQSKDEVFMVDKSIETVSNEEENAKFSKENNTLYEKKSISCGTVLESVPIDGAGENDDDNYLIENLKEVVKKYSKRKERRKKRNLSEGENSDDPYIYEIH